MHCPFCNHTETQVMETRELDGGDSIRRRRRCSGCDRRFTTYERVELSMPDVLKSDGRKVPYQRSKLEYSMKLALRKRPVSGEALNNALDQVEAGIFKLGVREIPSTVIGEHVMNVLRELDTVAYIRFASVYRKFEDIVAFADVIQEIGDTGAGPATGAAAAGARAASAGAGAAVPSSAGASLPGGQGLTAADARVAGGRSAAAPRQSPASGTAGGKGKR